MVKEYGEIQHKKDIQLGYSGQHTQYVEAGRFLSWRLAWFTEPVLGQLRLHRETQSCKYRRGRGKRERKGHEKEEESIGAGEMAPTVKSTGPLLLKDPGLIPSTHLMAHNSLQFKSQGI